MATVAEDGDGKGYEFGLDQAEELDKLRHVVAALEKGDTILQSIETSIKVRVDDFQIVSITVTFAVPKGYGL